MLKIFQLHYVSFKMKKEWRNNGDEGWWRRACRTGWRTTAKLEILTKRQNLVRNHCISKGWVARAAQSSAFVRIDFCLLFINEKVRKKW